MLKKIFDESRYGISCQKIINWEYEINLLPTYLIRKKLMNYDVSAYMDKNRWYYNNQGLRFLRYNNFDVNHPQHYI